MKPDAAALQLQDVKIDVAAAVIMRLGSRQSSLILNEMDPQKAAVIDQYHRKCVRSQYVKGSLMNKRFPAAIAAVALLAGCQSPQAVKEIGRAPAMSPIGSGLAYGQTPKWRSIRKNRTRWRRAIPCGAIRRSALFKDARALNVGDILTVDIQINDKATFDNETESQPAEFERLNWDVNAEIFGWTPQWKTDITYGSESSDGKGKIERLRS